MKVGGKEYTATGIPAAGCAGNTVRINVKACGFPLAEEYVSPDQARQFAAELQLAANLAEGKTCTTSP